MESNTTHRTGWTFLGELSILFVSAALLSLAYPGYFSDTGFGWIALFAYIPIFAVIHRTRWYLTPLYGFAFGFVFYLCFNYWLKTFHPLAILLGPLVKGAELLLLFPCLKAADSWFGKRGYLVQALFWTAYTYVSQDWFGGYPYGMPAHALYAYLPLIQISSITGVWGITFLMLVPQTFIGNALVRRDVPFLAQMKKVRIDLIVYVIVASAALIFGLVSLHRWDTKEPDRTLKVATVQHSADSWKGGYTTYRNNFETLRDLSEEALEADPDLLVWSETAFVPSVEWHTTHPSNLATKRLVEDFVAFGKSLPVPLLTGNPEGVIDDPDKPAYDENNNWNRKDYNTSILFGNGRILGTYRKQHLVPLTEHFPYQKQMPRFHAFLKAHDYHWWEQGTESTVFRYDGVGFSTPICFEDTFGALNADFVKNGADLLVNLSNDSWSGAVSAEMQHAAIGVFRSVENRKSTIRGTNSGITCQITPTGRIVDPMMPFEKGWNTYRVGIYRGRQTIYTRYGDWFALLSRNLSYLLLLTGFIVHLARGVKRRKNKTAFVDQSPV